MAVRSSIVEEIPGIGKGHTQHGNGKGLGHVKHQEKAMADGVYEIDISGVSDVNSTTTYTNPVKSSLADGSTLFTEARDGSVLSTADGLRLETNSAGSGRLRVGVEFDADNQIKLGDLDALKFDFTMLEQNGAGTYSPALRLIIDADGDMSTTADRGELVFEYAYQGSAQGVDLSKDIEGTTVNANLTDWVAWQRSGGQNRDQIVNMTTFGDWADQSGYTPAGGLNFSEKSVILGFSVGLGSGGGDGIALVGNVQVGGVTYDFA